MMINLKPYGYSENYEIDQKGNVYNTKTGKKLKLSKDNCYYIYLDNGRAAKRAINTLYKQVFGKSFCTIDDIEDLQNEEWKQITFAKDYFISNKGRLKSCKKNQAIILKPDLTRKNKGYLRVQLYIKGKSQHYLIHRLVAFYFIENTPKKEDLDNYEIHHKNFVCTDNRVQNLQWVTKQEHQIIHKEANKEMQSKDNAI